MLLGKLFRMFFTKDCCADHHRVKTYYDRVKIYYLSQKGTFS